jgi:hypothetical protein
LNMDSANAGGEAPPFYLFPDPPIAFIIHNIGNTDNLKNCRFTSP